MPQSIHAFAEKVALIINGDSGVGRAVAIQLALQGCFVIITFQKTSKSDMAIVDELKSLGTLANAIEFTNAETLLKNVDQLFGRLDLLVNCVGIDDDAGEQIDSLTAESFELMKERPKPVVVNIINENQRVYFVKDLPANFRQNCIVNKQTSSTKSAEFVTIANHDDVARVVLFLLSSEAKSLDKQTLYTN